MQITRKKKRSQEAELMGPLVKITYYKGVNFIIALMHTNSRVMNVGIASKWTLQSLNILSKSALKTKRLLKYCLEVFTENTDFHELSDRSFNIMLC